MTLETLLAAIHLLALLTLVVFLSSSTALCQSQWLNGPALERLARLQQIYRYTLLALLLSGLARALWGLKGAAWYWSSPLLHLKLTLLLVVLLLAIQPALAIARWQRDWRQHASLPAAAQVQHTRRLLMWQAHLIPLVALLGVAFARGWGHS
jgi:putative membrane protein